MENSKTKLPLVVIFGRTNVGKSTLFNRLAEKNKALISEVPGTTRDSNIAISKWQGKIFQLIDLAGWDYSPGSKKDKGSVEEGLKKQAEFYLKKADLILFTVDNHTGVVSQDIELAKYINTQKELRKKTILVVNKVDNFKHLPESAEFYKLGLQEPIPVSSATGSGTGDLLDEIATLVKAPDESKIPELEEQGVKVCILGKPNVGKSSLLNKILGYERVVVSETAHTTREPQDTPIKYKDEKITLVDTAGINKKFRKLDVLGKSSVSKSLTAMRRSDIVLLVIDVNEGLTMQDSKLVDEIIEHQKSLIIIANKWDLFENKDTKEQTAEIYKHLPFITWAPIIFISCQAKKNDIIKTNKAEGEEKNKDIISKKIYSLLELIVQVNNERNQKLETQELHDFLLNIVKIHKPTKGKGYKRPHIKTIKQREAGPPVFEITIGPNDTLNPTYLRFIENQLRKFHGFIGTPIKTWLKRK
ncbi:MAG: ribosome biogenesis GTPase Der [Parcubacteria group bacterium]